MESISAYNDLETPPYIYKVVCEKIQYPFKSNAKIILINNGNQGIFQSQSNLNLCIIVVRYLDKSTSKFISDITNMVINSIKSSVQSVSLANLFDFKIILYMDTLDQPSLDMGYVMTKKGPRITVLDEVVPELLNEYMLTIKFDTDFSFKKLKLVTDLPKKDLSDFVWSQPQPETKTELFTTYVNPHYNQQPQEPIFKNNKQKQQNNNSTNNNWGTGMNWGTPSNTTSWGNSQPFSMSFGQQPTNTMQQPTNTMQQPTNTMQQPTNTMQQPTNTMQQPTFGQLENNPFTLQPIQQTNHQTPTFTTLMFGNQQSSNQMPKSFGFENISFSAPKS